MADATNCSMPGIKACIPRPSSRVQKCISSEAGLGPAMYCRIAITAVEESVPNNQDLAGSDTLSVAECQRRAAADLDRRSPAWQNGSPKQKLAQAHSISQHPQLFVPAKSEAKGYPVFGGMRAADGFEPACLLLCAEGVQKVQSPYSC